MDPSMKLLLDELKSLKHTVEQQLAESDLKHEERFKQLDEHLGAISLWKPQIDAWKPQIDATVGDLKMEIAVVRKHLDRVLLEQDSLSPGLLVAPETTAAASPAEQTVVGPIGHRSDAHHREREFGCVTTLSHLPVKGTHDSIFSKSHLDDYPSRSHAIQQPRTHDITSKLPKLHFPTFDGTSPKLWKSRCEDYFDLYSVHSDIWVKVSLMHFSGAAARWLQSVESRIRQLDWHQFCLLVHERFGRDHHDILIRQLFHIRQTGSVSEYVDQFSELIDQLNAYESITDPRYYIMRFIDGLKDDIRSIVLIQRPQDLDSAFVLAALQEEVADSSRKKEYRKQEFLLSKHTPRSPQPLPLPPPPHLPRAQVGADDRRTTEAVRTSIDDKMASLRAYRRAKGLCHKCSERWSREHKCAPTVQLHVLQEVWDLFQDEEVESASEQPQSMQEEHIFMALSEAAFTGQETPRTMKFNGHIQKEPLLILIDSGSSHSFLSATVAAHLQGISALCPPIKVHVANGALLYCTSELVHAEWFINSYQFHSTLKNLPLPQYDLILGMDWLEAFSPMKVHWGHKWMSIPYNGHSVLLQGMVPTFPACSLISLCMITDQSTQSPAPAIPTCIQSLLQEFAAVFATPSELPPSRTCDHHIPLIPGARPFSIRQYRYAPALKDKIEKQVSEMLQTGVIQPS
ncbi:uncharacterized protein LOC133928395 [Phragmites australis]|uniref:uncharacterized protein LOC133928395 n=1 Tax=Phragmites australis TaxID=29695 RepID=UPI002D770939|nr:uncharacterized protein LOC133928395 [Phragmites australis]